ncbi:X-ray repair cross-complementing protein 6 [Lampetra fluviatilis]
MSFPAHDWKEFAEKDVDEEEEEAAEGQGNGGPSVSRDSLVFLVDASEAMFIKEEDSEHSPFEMSIKCVHSVYLSRVISRERDLLGLVFFGTEKHTNELFKHVYVYHSLDIPGASRIQELARLTSCDVRSKVESLLGHSTDFSLRDAFFTCSQLFSASKDRLSHRRVLLLTNQDEPHADNAERAKLARTKAADLRGIGVTLEVLPLGKAGGFRMDAFYRDIVSEEEGGGGDPGASRDPACRLGELLQVVRTKDYPKRAMARLPLKLGEGLSLGVAVYTLTRTAHKSFPVKLYRETNEPVKAKKQTFHAKTGRLLLPSDTKKSQVYGYRQIVLENEEVQEVKKFFDPGLVLVGFKPMEYLKKHHHLRPTQYIYPEESLFTGSARLFTALLTQCLKRGVWALCHYTPRRNAQPRLVGLLPQDEVKEENGAQVTPPGFHILFLPFADDVRNVPKLEGVGWASREQVDKMKAIVERLKFTYRSESFENPSVQQHYRNLEAMALDLEMPEAIVDYTRPPVERIEERAGTLISEFKELVFPPGYEAGQPSGVKRKSAVRKTDKPKVELVLSNEDVRAMVLDGSLVRHTVATLRDICKRFQLRHPGSKKQDLIDSITNYFSKTEPI